MPRIAAGGFVSPRITLTRSGGAVRFNEGQTKSAAPAAANHATRRGGEVHSIFASRLRMTITGVNATLICEISLRTSAVSNHTKAAKAKLARSDASRGSDIQAAAAHTPMTYSATIPSTWVFATERPHTIPMLLWYPRRISNEYLW